MHLFSFFFVRTVPHWMCLESLAIRTVPSRRSIPCALRLRYEYYTVLAVWFWTGTDWDAVVATWECGAVQARHSGRGPNIPAITCEYSNK